MFHFKAFLLCAVSLAGLSLAASHPLKRQQPADCSATVITHASLVLAPLATPEDTGSFINVGINPSVTHEGIDGQQDSLLITRNDQGGYLTGSSLFDYVECTNDGIVRPSVSIQHCLALESTTDVGAARNSVVDSYCSQVPAEYRLFTYVNESLTGNNSPFQLVLLNFASENMTVIIGDTAHGEVQFYPEGTYTGSAQPKQLALYIPS